MSLSLDLFLGLQIGWSAVCQDQASANYHWTIGPDQVAAVTHYPSSSDLTFSTLPENGHPLPDLHKLFVSFSTECSRDRAHQSGQRARSCDFYCISLVMELVLCFPMRCIWIGMNVLECKTLVIEKLCRWKLQSCPHCSKLVWNVSVIGPLSGAANTEWSAVLHFFRQAQTITRPLAQIK